VIKKAFTTAKWQLMDSGNQEPVTNFMRGTYSVSMYPSGLLNMTVTRRGCDRCNPFDRKYTKHYYAGSQRIMSKIGSDTNIGKFDCDWLIIPFSDGVPAINTEEILAKSTAAEDKMLKKYNITPAPDYGQNAGFLNGYNSKCVPSHGIDFAVEKQQSYWYHSDHLGSASYVTDCIGSVSQFTSYLPTGELLSEQKYLDKLNSPYKFNGKEQDSETGYYYYGARYYNPKVSLWLNVDPLADYNPHMNDEHYKDGEHNGGVFNQMNNNPYIYCYQSPVKYVDPNGKQSESGATISAHKTTMGDRIQEYRDYKPRFSDMGGQVFKPLIDGALDLANSIRNIVFDKKDYSGLAPAATKWNGFSMSGSESQDMYVNGLLTAGSVMHAGVASTIPKVKTNPVKTSTELVTNTIYKRPNNATTQAQRAFVQNKPCITCNVNAPKMYADHKTPLVMEHYQTGTIDKVKMRSLEAVQPQCPTCSSKQGADMSRYSKEMKQKIMNSNGRK
jgi:RHS repeat-associated protein